LGNAGLGICGIAEPFPLSRASFYLLKRQAQASACDGVNTNSLSLALVLSAIRVSCTNNLV